MQERNCALSGERGCPKCCEGKNPSSCFISGLSRSPLERDIGVALEFQPLPFFFWSCLRDRHDTLYQVDIEFGPLLSLPFFCQVPFDRISQRPKDEGREEGDGKGGRKEAMDCFAASGTVGGEREGSAKEIKSALEIVFLPSSIRNLSDHPPLALTKDWTSEEGAWRELD